MSSNIKVDKFFSIKNLFSVKFSKIISQVPLLINIDEYPINRNIKSNNSCCFKESLIEIQNTVIDVSVIVVMSICSNNLWINLLVNKTITHTILNGFKDYVKLT